MARMLDPEDARRYYDWFGARQDSQGFYEDKALEALVAAGAFGDARAVFEFGCGTGRFAETLLNGPLPEDARYAGCDLSATMAGLSRDRLARFGDRVAVWQTGPEPDFAPGTPPFDRIVTTYVFDLMPPEAVGTALAAMHEALVPGGLLCAVGLTHGHGMSGVVSAFWGGVHRIAPRVVGGCRPGRVAPRLDTARWRISHDETVVAWGVPSEVLVAARL